MGRRPEQIFFQRGNADGQQPQEKMLSIANHQGSANQVRMAITEKNTNNKFGEGVEKKEPSYTVDGNVNWCNHCGKQYGGFSKN